MGKLFNSFKLKTFRDFYTELKNDFKLQNSDKYYAHIFKNENGQNIKEPEKLIEHLDLVIKYFFSIIESHKLENLIDNCIKSIQIDQNNHISEVSANLIKKIFFESIYFHDIGKINENFQYQKMNNPNFKNEIFNGLATDHSLLSVYLFFHNTITKLNNIPIAENFICSYFLLLMCLSINRHHSPFLSNFFDEKLFPDDNNYLKNYLEMINLFHNYNNCLNNITQNEQFRNSICSLHKSLSGEDTSFILFLLTKLNYSLLTASDYYATFNYKQSLNNEIIINNFGIINDELKNRIFYNFYSKKDYNKKIKNKIELTDFNLISEKSKNNLNLLRENIAIEIKNNIQKNYMNNLFYLEAPTGSGKTNLSFLCITELLQRRKELNKIFYVLPFIALITQTHDAMFDTFGLSQNEIIDFHSRTGLHFKERPADFHNALWLDFIDYLFLNYPLTLLSHITFFDILKSNLKDNNYILQRIANSIVVIDEIQSYNPKHWDKLNLFLQLYSKYLNTVFIVMSATLPKIDKLLSGFDNNYKFDNNFISLVMDKEKYYTNSNFKERVTFDFSLTKEKIELQKLCDVVFDKSEQYFEKNNKVNTLIEFIFKKTAGDFYNICSEKFINNGYEIFVLTGTILEPRRKEVLYQLNKYKELNDNKKILFITTQVIESGVDIDFDIGFKDMSIIDSEEQFAGRINRNATKNNSQVFIFKYDNENLIYRNDLRLNEMNDDINNKQQILTDKNFDKIYNNVIEKINKNNNNEFILNIRDYIEHIKKLNFSNIHSDFCLISERTISVFVPLDIKIEPFNNLRHFTDIELNFIKRFTNQKFLKCINGALVWDIFENLLLKKSDVNNFFDFNIDLKILQGLMSKFCFSIFKYSNLIDDLKVYCDNVKYINYGILYLVNFDVYSFEFGLNINKLNFSNFI